MKIAVRQSGGTVVMKGFGMGERAEEFKAFSGPDGRHAVDVAFEVERDSYGGLGLIPRECRAVEVTAAGHRRARRLFLSGFGLPFTGRDQAPQTAVDVEAPGAGTAVETLDVGNHPRVGEADFGLFALS